ncbi:hypothetical protein BpHYR1_026079 [Brachionus plicatilis]|uniref:Uncharacterized protein n=1 Tax=Brachionus plicatilis TaxID=10195 RepID=A0A3M7S5T7_BRAPC|nr:hypothetical protein BpHYR1_026079 [Brachionus plicatilis]
MANTPKMPPSAMLSKKLEGLSDLLTLKNTVRNLSFRNAKLECSDPNEDFEHKPKKLKKKNNSENRKNNLYVWTWQKY